MTSQPTHITTQEWSAFRRRSLSNDQLLRVSDHVHQCELCRRAYRTTPHSGDAVPELPAIVTENVDAPLHLTFEQLSSYLSAAKTGKSNWAAVEQHLAFCRLCATELRELSEFDAKTDVASRREAPAPARLAKSTFVEAIRNFFAVPQTPAFTGLATAMAMAGLFILMSGVGLVATTPSPAAGADTSDTYLARGAFSMLNLTGALLALAGVAALVYRFTARKPVNGQTTRRK